MPGSNLCFLTVSSIVATFTLIVLGGVVRVTESGLGCPDWPLCNGKLIPQFEFHVLIEYSHRLMASLVAILVLIQAGVLWWRYSDVKRIVIPGILSVVFLVIQVILGGITVLKELPPNIVTVHLGVSQVIFALLLAILILGWVKSQQERSGIAGVGTDSSVALCAWTVLAALGIYVVTLSGSFMVGSNAGFACSTWPLCNGGFFPEGNLAWIHMGHRWIVGIVGLLVLWCAFLSWRERTNAPIIRRVGVLVAILLIVQILVGAGNVWTGLQPILRVLHLALATGLWGGLVVLGLLVYQNKLKASFQGSVISETLE
jgi:heme A synthase